MQKKFVLPLLFFALLLKTISSYAQGPEEVPADSARTPEEHRFGFIDANGYYDTRDWSTFTLNYLAILNKRLVYFAFINYQQGSLDPTKIDDFDSYYSEHNLTYTPFMKIPIDINVQFVSIAGAGNDKIRFAPSWRVHNTPILDKLCKAVNLTYGINFHVIQLGYDPPLDDFTWQMEHFYKFNILPTLTHNRLYLSGFADHTMGGPIAKGLVMEHQVGVRLVDQFYAVCEYRHFSYFPDKYKDGFGLGVEYLILFK